MNLLVEKRPYGGESDGRSQSSPCLTGGRVVAGVASDLMPLGPPGSMLMSWTRQQRFTKRQGSDVCVFD